MMHYLESNDLKIAVSNTGAELKSLFSKKTGTEYLWQGDPFWWGSSAPVLFPVIGALKDGSLPKHGFVRQAYFYSRNEQNKLIFEYVDNPLTRTVYPYAFTFSVAFSLVDNVLTIENRVTNNSETDLYFSVGAHEAYACGGDFDDYFIEFEKEETLESLAVNTKTGLLSGTAYPVKLEGGHLLPLAHGLFENDALIFKNIKNKRLFVKSKKSNGFIEVAYDAPNLGIWTKPGAPYICIEPWWGLPDYDDSEGGLPNKDGIVKLGKGKEFISNHSITVVEC
jgi:galactose mutarotase-like enzyme